jgi:hypothetical protein
MKSNINETLNLYTNIPKSWYLLPHFLNYDKRTPQQHYDEGWRDFVEPVFDPETERKTGELVFNQGYDKVTYKVEPLTELEIEQRVEIERLNVIAQGRENQKEAIELIIRKDIIESAQELTDPEEILQNEYVYPIWEDMPDQYPFQLNKKYRSLDGLVLKVFNCIQPHNKVESDPSFIPINAPALWSLIEIGEDGTEIWTQPTGGDGKYPLKDPLTNEPYKVIHNGKLWENNFQGGLNVWEPGVFGWTDLGPI